MRCENIIQAGSLKLLLIQSEEGIRLGGLSDQKSGISFFTERLRFLH